jgi:Family of unknown function (DUF6535)
MSLVFSLSAGLIAALVQQWFQDYMQALQRYSHPSESARIRQYLCEGVEGWYMLWFQNLFLGSSTSPFSRSFWVMVTPC